MREDFKNNRRFFFGVTLVLFLSFFINFFGPIQTNLFVGNYVDSEALVINQITCKGAVYDNQMVMAVDPANHGPIQKFCDPTQLVPYQSQYGFQGRAYTAVYNVITKVVDMSPAAFVTIAQFMTALLSAVLFAIFMLWAKVRFGTYAAVTATVLLGMSPIPVAVGRNLYWALPLLALPFVYAIYGYRTTMNRQRKAIFYAAIGLLFYIRFLAGYEFITTMPISVMAVMAYHLYEAKVKKSQYLTSFALVLGVSLISFGAALATHIHSLKDSTGSYRAAAKVIQARAFERTTNTDDFLKYSYLGFKAWQPETYMITNTYVGLDHRIEDGSQVSSQLVSVLHYLLMPVFFLPIALNQPFATYAQSFSVFILALIFIYRRRASWLAKKQLEPVKGLYVAGLVGLAGYLSWVILARSHSLVHTQIVGVLMYLPFALYGFVIIGLYLQSLTNKVVKRRKK